MEVKRYLIVGPNCGRNAEGTFRCVCGRCRELPPYERENGCDSSDNSGQRGDNAKDSVDHKALSVRPLSGCRGFDELR